MALMDLVHPDAMVRADLLRLIELYEAERPAARERIRLSGDPTNLEEDDERDGEDGDKDAAEESEGKAEDEDAGSGSEKKPADDAAHWKKMARQNERAAKKERADREALAAKLKERDDADKTEQEKAIEAARAEGESKAMSAFEETRRDDRIEMAVVKAAGKEITIGEGDKAEKVKFADPDDAQLRLERAIRKGDIAYDDIYADGKVKGDALAEFLTDLLAENPHLRAGGSNGNGGGKKEVDFDAGKGKGGGGKSLEEMTPAEHLKQIQGAR